MLVLRGTATTGDNDLSRMGNDKPPVCAGLDVYGGDRLLTWGDRIRSKLALRIGGESRTVDGIGHPKWKNEERKTMWAAFYLKDEPGLYSSESGSLPSSFWELVVVLKLETGVK